MECDLHRIRDLHYVHHCHVHGNRSQMDFTPACSCPVDGDTTYSISTRSIYLCSWADTKYCTTKSSVKSYKVFWLPGTTFAHSKNSAVKQEPKEAANIIYLTCSPLPLSWPWCSGEKVTYLLTLELHIQQIQL